MNFDVESESEGGQKFLVDVHSQTPFLFARPSNWILKFGIWIFVKKCSDFVQTVPHWQVFIGMTRVPRKIANRAVF